MDLGLETIGGASGLVVLTAFVTRWLSIRRDARRDALEQLQDAYQQALQRLAHVEGRADEQSRAVIAAQQQLAEESVRYASRVNELEIRVAQLELEREQLRARVAALELERDELAAELAGRPRRTTPRPFPAQSERIPSR